VYLYLLHLMQSKLHIKSSSEESFHLITWKVLTNQNNTDTTMQKGSLISDNIQRIHAIKSQDKSTKQTEDYVPCICLPQVDPQQCTTDTHTEAVRRRDGPLPSLSVNIKSSWIPWEDICQASHQPSDASTPNVPYNASDNSNQQCNVLTQSTSAATTDTDIHLPNSCQ